MITAPTGWPDEARKKALLAAATRMRDACQWGGPPEDWLRDAEAILSTDFADLIAAAKAQARLDALEEAARIADEVGFNPSGYGTQQKIAAVIRAKAQETNDE